jgi:CheY-like chemotaxis protein/DNA-binding CsgD family transcriptional regulator
MSPHPGTILIIDDTPANISLVLDALTGAGHRLLIAESGLSALEQLEHAQPDLILLDVMMPGLDGFATCAKIKARPGADDIPILFMTALDEPEQKVRALKAGAVDYITKPFHVPEVLARVATHLQLRALRRSLEDELALRVDAENQLSQSLDRAVVLVDAGNRIVFTTRLAESLLHKHCADYEHGRLPPSLAQAAGLTVRRFAERGRDDLAMLVLEEKEHVAGPAALLRLGLTTREAEVLFWIAQGKSNPDIATILGAGVRTVHKHVEHVFQKLGVETRAAAAIAAHEALRA